MFVLPRQTEVSRISALISGITIKETLWRIKMQINQTMDLEMKINQFEKDYHNGPADEGRTRL